MRTKRPFLMWWGLVATGSVTIYACGGGDASAPATEASDGGSYEAAPPVPPVKDAGSGTETDSAPEAAVDSGGDADAGCGALALTEMVPAQGFNGIEMTVQIAGSGLGTCTSSTSCPDHFSLVLCDVATADAGDAGDGGDAGDAGDAGDVADAGACTPDAGAVTIHLTTLRSDGNVATVVIPAGAPLGGPFTLIDEQNGCVARLASAYTSLGPSANVSVTSVDPNVGWTGADTPITIRGTGFVSTPSAYINVPGATPAWQKLKNVAFVSPTSITAVVPKGLPASPTNTKYAIAVVDPDGQGNTLADAFRVVSEPAPAIASASPSSITTSQLGTANNVTVTGCNFRAPLTVQTVDTNGAVVAQSSGAPTCDGAATCPDGSNVCTLQTTVGGIGTGAYVLRVTDNDQGTSGEYSALVVTDPSAKLNTGFVASGHSLVNARRSLVTTSARIDAASRFLFAIGGEKADGTTLSSVEVAPLDKFGTLGDWFVEKNALGVPRSGASIAQLGQYIYVIGGTSTKGGTSGLAPLGTPLATIERAKILDGSDIPALAEPTILGTGNLTIGTWYYRVAAVRDGTDPDNPNGETLASDQITAVLGFKGGVSLSWTAPGNAAHIGKYRIYRSAAANATSGSEVFLAEATGTTFTDDGSVTPGTDQPLARGSTGTWATLSTTLLHARENAAATIATDPNGQSYLYVMGGWGKCTGALVNGLMGCWELATISADGKTLGSFTNGTNALAYPRMRHGVARMASDNGISGWSGNASFVVVAGGQGPTNPNNTIEIATVTNGGQLGTFSGGGTTSARDGESLQIANGYLYQFFGKTGGAYTSGGVLANVTAETASTLTLSAWSNAASTLPGPLGQMGVTLESAYFYVIGGTTNDLDAVSSVYQIIY